MAYSFQVTVDSVGSARSPRLGHSDRSRGQRVLYLLTALWRSTSPRRESRPRGGPSAIRSQEENTVSARRQHGGPTSGANHQTSREHLDAPPPRSCEVWEKLFEMLFFALPGVHLWRASMRS